MKPVYIGMEIIALSSSSKPDIFKNELASLFDLITNLLFI